jgi:hypothetical protein
MRTGTAPSSSACTVAGSTRGAAGAAEVAAGDVVGDGAEVLAVPVLQAVAVTSPTTTAAHRR